MLQILHEDYYSYNHQDFLEAWTTAQNKAGFVLLLEPNANFFALTEDKTKV